MLFHIGFVIVGLTFLSIGLLMFAFPLRYVRLANWYFDKTGSTQRLSPEKYKRWDYRIGGLCAFFVSLLIFYQYVLILIHH